jgi:hypothetical protein
MSIDRDTLRRILQGEAEQRGLELRGGELVGADSDLEAVVAAVTGQLGLHLDPSGAAAGLISQGRLNVDRLASLLSALDVEAETGPVELADAGLPGDDDSDIDGFDRDRGDDEEDLGGDDDSRID